MSVYLVTWELNKEKPNYATARAQLLSRLNDYDGVKDQGLDTVRFVSTNWSADEVSADLRKKMDNNDRLMVTKLIVGNHQGWLSQEVWDWINSHL